MNIVLLSVLAAVIYSCFAIIFVCLLADVRLQVIGHFPVSLLFETKPSVHQWLDPAFK